MCICNLSLLNANHSHWFPKRKNRWDNGASVFHWPYFNCLRAYVLRKDVGMRLNKALRAMRGEESSRLWKDHLPALSSCGLFSVLTHLWSLFSFWSYELRASPVQPHLIWITSLQVLSPNTVTLGINWASTQEFLWGDTVQCILQRFSDSFFILLSVLNGRSTILTSSACWIALPIKLTPFSALVEFSLHVHLYLSRPTHSSAFNSFQYTSLASPIESQLLVQMPVPLSTTHYFLLPTQHASWEQE